MRISSARFVKSARQPGEFPNDGRGEVAFLGRSNIGKSTLLNTLVNSRRLARTSSSPGRTQTINFYAIDDQGYFVDLPGYGYARVPKGVRTAWHRTVESYLENRSQLKLALLLVDCRIPPTPADAMMKQWLDHYHVPNVVILTKVDKISRNRLNQALQKGAQALTTNEIIPFSATTHLGKERIWVRIRAAIGQG